MFLLIRSAVTFACLSLMFLVLPGCGGGEQADGLYKATTDDNIKIGMRRYRPSAGDQYGKGKPVLLFAGIVNNINQFDVRTPEGVRGYNYKLPGNVPDEIRNDPVIQQDQMKYFSLAHYLYRHGYDVWMANFRGVGRDAYASEDGHGNTNLDVWCGLDFPAAVDKIRAVTGKKPVIGGFSTGGMCAYQYLQGTTLDADIVKRGKYIPHIESSDALAAQRNRNVAGVLAIDPAGAPKLAYDFLINHRLGWDFLALETKFDLDAVIPVATNILPPVVVAGATDLMFKTIGNLADSFPGYLPGWADLFGALHVWNSGNTNGYVEDFMVREGLSGFYFGSLAQFVEWGVNGELREHWQNGEENKSRIVPLRRQPGDGYYYYDDNIVRLTAPMFSVFSESQGAVSTQRMVNLIYNQKTVHVLDQWIEIPGTAHVDLVGGNQAPKVSFPAIVEWLDRL